MDQMQNPASAAAPTPMMAQYMEIRAANPGVLLFYRMGDFYELFFDDAEVASQALGITLTKRGQHLGQDIPMCGVPVHAADDYLHRLIRLGHKVAVCEQLEDPAEAKKRGSKSVVKRDVVRLVTPGTLTEDKLLEQRRANYLASLARIRSGDADTLALAWLDLSTGAFSIAATTAAALPALMARIEPREIVVADTLLADEALNRPLRDCGATLTPLPRDHFDSVRAERTLCDFFRIASLDAFGMFERAELAAAGALVAYVDMTQFGRRPSISPPRRESQSAFMAIDPATRANLELTRTLQGESAGSLLATIDRTVSAAGARLLAEHLAAPLTDPALIEDRLDAVDSLVETETLRDDCRALLKQGGDMARSLQRLSLMRGGPRDLDAIRSGLETAVALAQALKRGAGLAPLCHALAEAASLLAAPPTALSAHLSAALADDLPMLTRDGGYVRSGYDKDLDDTRALRDDSRRIIAGLQAQYATLADVKSLKIKFNNVLGYFIEVSAQNGQRLLEAPLAETFIHRQTLANVMRFSTVELGALQARIAEAGERAVGIELDIFARLRDEVLAAGETIKSAADAAARIDVHAALAELAAMQAYCRPKVDAGLAFRIEGGRHPVVEQALRREAVPFIANDCDLGPAEGADDAGKLWLLTGPNMAGKSTFLRQNALIAILAQAGSFVPARAAHIGVVDRLFSRVGAADDLARGRSTFMVEMVETAAILNQAGSRALVILDEIGRGTATFDGLSIAWASIEHLHEVNRSRALFATHYHELTSLAGRLERIVNATVKVREWDGEVIFLHEVVPGSADRSYGIQVARLAGLPDSVVERARAVLEQLEEGDTARAGRTLIDDLPLFSAARHETGRRNSQDDRLSALLRDISPDELSPRDALDLVYAMKRELANQGKGSS